MKWESARLVAPLLLLFSGNARVKAVDETPLVRTEVDGAEETELYVPIGFKVEKVLAVPESQGSWVSLALDNKGRFITSDQQGLLYRVTLQSGGQVPLVEPLSVFVTDAMHQAPNNEHDEHGRSPRVAEAHYIAQHRRGPIIFGL